MGSVTEKKPATSQFLKFLITGGISALVNLASRYVLNYFLPFSWSVIFAYTLGMLTAYNLFRIYVFAPSGRKASSEAWRFVLVNIVSLGIVWGVSMVLNYVLFPKINFAWHREAISHFIGVLSPAVPSFIGHKFFSFKEENEKPSDP
ncbi:GtrA family protein [Asaia astilbis]